MFNKITQLPSTISHHNKRHRKLIVAFYMNADRPKVGTSEFNHAADVLNDSYHWRGVLHQDRIVGFRNAMEPWVACE